VSLAAERGDVFLVFVVGWGKQGGRIRPDDGDHHADEHQAYGDDGGRVVHAVSIAEMG
jgi:hypothetical protein